MVNKDRGVHQTISDLCNFLCYEASNSEVVSKRVYLIFDNSFFFKCAILPVSDNFFGQIRKEAGFI